MPSKKNDQIAEQLFEMVDIIADAKLKALQYDKTYKANIINIDKADLGRYICQMENLRFEAIGGEGEYKVGDTVYVMVPQDNWDNQKHIIGRYVSNKSNAVYISPFEEFFYPSERPFYTSNIEVGVTPNQNLIANEVSQASSNPKYGNEAGEDYSQYQIGDIVDITEAYTEPFTTLGIRASFYTNLNQWGILSGEQGIKIEFLDISQQVIGERRFSSDQLFGAIYNFPDQAQFEQIFNIDTSLMSATKYFRLKLYENEDFLISSYVSSDNLQSALFKQGYDGNDGDTCSKPVWVGGRKDIKVNNVQLFFGYDTKDFSDKNFQLSSYGNLKGMEQWGRWSNEENDKFFYYTYIYKNKDGQWKRKTNRISALLKCMGDSTEGWTEIYTYQQGTKTAPIKYNITPTERVSTSNSIRFKARIDLKGDEITDETKSVESNIITFYKHDDGTYDCSSGEKASEDKDKEEEKTDPEIDEDRKYKSLLMANQGSDDYAPHWYNGFTLYKADKGLDKGEIEEWPYGNIRLAHPTLGYYHPANSRYTDVRITISCSDRYENNQWYDDKDDHWRLGNANLMPNSRTNTESYLRNNNQGFRFAHHTTWKQPDPVAHPDWVRSCIIGLEFTETGLNKIMPTEDRFGKTWKDVTVRPETMPLNYQLWKTSYYLNNDGTKTKIGNYLGNWGVSMEIQKLTLTQNDTTGVPEAVPQYGSFVTGQDTDLLVINAKDILNGFSENSYASWPIQKGATNVNGDAPDINAHSSYLEAVLYFRLKW